MIHNQVLAPEALRTLVAYLDAAGINSVLEEPDYCYCRDLSEEYFQGMMQNMRSPSTASSPCNRWRACASTS